MGKLENQIQFQKQTGTRELSSQSHSQNSYHRHYGSLCTLGLLDIRGSFTKSLLIPRPQLMER